MSIAEFTGTRRIEVQSPALTVSDAAQAFGIRARTGPRRVRGGEVVRKIMHMSPGVLPFVLALIPHPRTLPWESLQPVIALTAVLTGFYILAKRIVRRPGENNFFSTCLSYPATVLATLVLFPQHPEFTCVVVVVLALGDGAAYIGGNLFGRRKLPWNRQKTWIGSLCFIAVGAPIATLAYWMEANAASLGHWGTAGPITVPFAMAALCGTTATVIASLAESLPTELTDNLRVGVAASIAVVAVHYLSAGWFLA